jgi:hypothetical protein
VMSGFRNKLKTEAVPVHTMKVYRHSTGIAPRILNVSTICRWIVNSKPQPLYL